MESTALRIAVLMGGRSAEREVSLHTGEQVCGALSSTPMKRAAAEALAALAKEPVPVEVLAAYGVDHLEFGPDYIVPKPLDRRVCLWEAPAVAKAAMDSGVARVGIDLDCYRQQLAARLIA